MVYRLLSGLLGFPSAIALYLICASAIANPVVTENTEAQLVSEVTAVQPGKPFWVALRLDVREGWHSYWRNPGDTGMATTLAWTLPAGFEAGEILWPTPERILVGPLMNYGYHGEVYLLTEITVPEALPGVDSVTLRAQANWLVCEVMCIPEQAVLSLELPVDRDAAPADIRWADAFARTRQALPMSIPWPVTFTTTPDKILVTVADEALGADGVAAAWFLPFESGVIEHGAPQAVAVEPDGLVLDIPRGERRQEPLTRLQGLLVVQAREGVQEAFRIDTVSATGESIKPSSFPSMVRQLLFAFLGGLILNLMPCVFPVLSMKAVSFADIARKSPWEVRAHGLVFTAGVLVCFAVIVAILLALRAGGAEIGWGFQLQSPVFVTLLAYLMFAVGLNLSGVFTIGTRLMGLGSGLAVHPGYLGTFATGVLATLVATPCTAPFMGVALGYALTQPWQVSLLIFEALGLGLAFPYLLLSLSPKLLRFLPKPGVWMERLKEFLAFPMYATAAWLVWVLTLQTGSAGILAALIGMILIALGAWSYQSTRMAGPRWHWVGRIGAVVAFAIALGLVRVPVVNDAGEVASASRQVGQGPAWEPFSRPRLVEIIAEGRPAFVNFTAAWCITCLANERVALSSPRLAALFEKRGIVYLKADWTRQDPEITRMLSSFGRSGVPLYVYYPPAGAEPVILPQILTEAVVLENLGVSLDAKMMEGMDP